MHPLLGRALTPELWKKDAEIVPRGKLQLHPHVALSAGRGVHRRLRPAGAVRRTRGAALLGRAIREPFFKIVTSDEADSRPARARQSGNGAGLSEPSVGDHAVAGERVGLEPVFRPRPRAGARGRPHAPDHLPRSVLGQIQQPRLHGNADRGDPLSRTGRAGEVCRRNAAGPLRRVLPPELLQPPRTGDRSRPARSLGPGAGPDVGQNARCAGLSRRLDLGGHRRHLLPAVAARPSATAPGGRWTAGGGRSPSSGT